MARKKPKKLVASDGEEVVPGRYLYQPGCEPPSLCWLVLAPGSAPLNIREGHDRVAARFTKESKGKWAWRWDEVLLRDFDYPSFLAPELGSEHIASCAWLHVADEDKGPPLADWLKTLKAKRQAVHIPDGKAKALRNGRMSNPAVVGFAKGKTLHEETYAHPAQAALVALLANLGIRGQFKVPADETACDEWRNAIQNRLADARRRFDDLAGLRANKRSLRKAIAGVLMQWFLHGRR